MSLSVSLAMALLVALLLDALLGEPDWLWRRLPHPAVLLGRAVGALEQQLNQGPQRRAKGVLTLLVLMGGAGALGWALSYLGVVAEIVIAAILLAQRSLCDHVAAVQAGLRQSLEQGRFAVSMIVSRNTAEMNEADVTRAAIESGAENLSDGVIAPALWFLLGGLPGILIYKAVNTADSMIGYRNERYEQFGWGAARMDDLLNLIPARLTALLLALGGGQLRAWPEIARDARRHRSPNAGWPEAALSRGLDLALAGPRVYDGKRQELAWVNPKGSHEAQAGDIARAVRALWHSWGLFVGGILALTLVGMLI